MKVSIEKTCLLVGVMALLCATAVSAQEPDTRAARLQQQRQEKSQQLRPYQRTGLESALYEFKERRIIERFQAGYRDFHPLLGGLSTGSGFALGTQYLKTDIAGALDFRMSGQASLLGYQRYKLGLSTPDLAQRKLFLTFDFTQNNAPQEDFFGVGSDSSNDDRTNFRLETTEYVATAGVRPFTKLEVGAHGGVLNTNAGHGTDSRYQSVEEVFSSNAAPGLDRQPHYDLVGAFVKLDSRDQPGNPRSGTLFQVDATYFNDRTQGAYSFRRWKAEVQQYIPFFNERRVIAFRGKFEANETNSDQQIPFFMMPTLGGSEDLRGYTEFRFRDKHLLVMNLEYRWEAFSGLDLALFGDAGDVYSKTNQIKLDKLKTSYGFGFRFNTERSVFWRIDVGFSPDDTRTFLKFNHVF
jgi:outer membrane protein assembly factor BamA